MIYFKNQYIELDNISLIENEIQKNKLRLRELQSHVIINLLCDSFNNINTKTLKELFSPEDKVILDDLFNQNRLLLKLNSELDTIHSMDRMSFSKSGNYLSQRVPYGVVLNISASNVLLGVIDNFINLILTKNFSLIKISQSNEFACFKFFEELVTNSELKDFFCLISFKGGDIDLEDSLVHMSDLIMLWGGEDLINTYRQRYSKKIISHGPRISFSVIDYNQPINFDAFITDFTRWNQKACSNSQVLYIKNLTNQSEFLDQLEKALKSTYHNACDDEQVEILKEFEFARYREYNEDSQYRFEIGKYLITFEKDIVLRTSSLNHSLVIKQFENESCFTKALRNHQSYLQSVSTNYQGNERFKLINLLSSEGVTRFTDLGNITNSTFGTPHEGDYALQELTRLIVDESLSNRNDHGYIYASGGTTGEPKLKNYAYGEFSHTAHKLASTYTDLLHLDNPIVANLFMAGNMWSSFNVIQKALESIDIIQLPLGGSMDVYTLDYFMQRLKPNVIFGIPSLLFNYAQFLKKQHKSFDINYVYFAGERLNKSHKDLFDEVFNEPIILSAGYASVEVGLIGYQPQGKSVDQFKLFYDVDFKIINDELVVKSRSHDYIKTGDLVDYQNGIFRLLGRVDKIIEIFGTRISLELLCSEFSEYQFDLIISEEQEKILFRCESEDLEFLDKVESFYQKSFDLKNTYCLDAFKSKILYSVSGHISSKRTGKSLKVRDLRS